MGTNVDWFIDMIADEENKEKARNNEFSSKDRIRFMCKEHGEYYRRVSDVITITSGERRRGCPQCDKLVRLEHPDRFGKIGFRKNIYSEEFIAMLAKDEDKEKARKGILRSSDVVTFHCPKHGDYDKMVKRVYRISDGTITNSCKGCRKGHKSLVSTPATIIPDAEIKLVAEKQSKKFKAFIDSLGVPYTILANCVFPSFAFNDQKLVVVYRDTTISQEHDNLVKMERFYDEKGVNFVSVFDSDYYPADKSARIEEVLKGFIKGSEQVYARTCKVISIPSSVGKAFCDKYHISKGTIMGSVYALVPKDSDKIYDETNLDEIYCVMGFSKKRFAKTEEDQFIYELKRYCVRTGIVIPGGAKRLFSIFLEENKDKVKTVVCYSDCDFFRGTVYPYLGFKFDGYTALSYFWQKSLMEVRTRESCQVKKLKLQYPELYNQIGEGKISKEDFIMEHLGFFRGYRMGNKKWIYNVE